MENIRVTDISILMTWDSGFLLFMIAFSHQRITAIFRYSETIPEGYKIEKIIEF